MCRINSEGVTRIGLIVGVVVIILLAGVTTWMVSGLKTDTKVPAKQASTTVEKPKPEKVPPAYVTFKFSDLGAALSFPSEFTDLTYSTKTITLKSGEKVKADYVSTKKLTDMDAACAATTDTPALGMLIRGSGTFSFDKADGAQMIRQMPDYYVAYSEPQAQCSTNSATQTAAKAAQIDFHKAVMLAVVNQL